MDENDKSTNSHKDEFSFLNQKVPLKNKILKAHQVIKDRLPFIARVALALYDPKTTTLKTFIHSSGEDNPLDHYEAKIDNAPSLKKMLETGQPRVVNKMLTFEKQNGEGKEHIRRLGRQGYAASYTTSVFNNGEFLGFLFFNSYETDVFSETVLHEIDTYAHLISLTVINELNSFQTLSAALKTTSSLTHERDPETGSHLDRMSRYSRIIVKVLADKYDLKDDYIEHVFMYAPLHDVGKIAIPDEILLKRGKLTGEEMEIMKTHSLRGLKMVNGMIKNFSLEEVGHTEILKNITAFHHEAVDGSGYPYGKKGVEIPLEARVVSVADIFDALTSKRPYKEAWSNEEAFSLLKKLSGVTLDSDCVEALLSQEEAIIEIQNLFDADTLG